MGIAIATIGAVFGAVGVAGFAAPGAMAGAIDGFRSSPVRIYGWAGVRVIIGMVLALGAPATASPTLIRVIGAVVVVKAALVPVLGLDRVRSLLGWFQARSPVLVRFLFLLVASFGGFLVWAALAA